MSDKLKGRVIEFDLPDSYTASGRWGGHVYAFRGRIHHVRGMWIVVEAIAHAPLIEILRGQVTNWNAKGELGELYKRTNLPEMPALRVDT